MTEAVLAVKEWACGEHGLDALFLVTHPDNVASQRVAEKAGFIRVGDVERGPAFADGTHRALRFEHRVPAG